MHQNGKWYRLLLLICTTLCAEVTLEVRSMQEKNLEHAGVGTPFIIDVTVDTVQNSSNPKVTVPDGCLFHSTSVKTLARIWGGRSVEKKVYRYMARIDTPGTWTIGPATVRDGDNQEISSQAVTLVVAHTQKEEDEQPASSSKRKQGKKSSDKQQDTILVTAEIDKESLVQGESAQLTYTFYSADSSVNLERIVEPEYSVLGLEVQENGPMKTGTTKRDGTLYSYVQLTRTITPTQTGSYIIPACKVDYSVRSAQNSYFSLVLGRRVVKTAYSNGVSLQVDQLPVADDMIDFLGTCTQCTATLSDPSIVQSQAATLTFHISGDIQWKKEAFTITNGPSSVRLFPSQRTCKETPSGRTYSFEFVMQASGQPGDYVVPAQTIVGFDTKLRKVVQHVTHDIPFTITVQSAQTHHAVVKTAQPQASEPVDPLLPLLTDTWNPYKKREMSWPLWCKLALIPLLSLILIQLAHRVRSWLASYRPYVRWHAGRRFRARLARAQATHTMHGVYQAFLDYLAAVAPDVTPTSQAYTNWIERICDSEQVSIWKEVIKRLQETQYATSSHLYNDSTMVFDQLRSLLAVIEAKTVTNKKRFALFLILMCSVHINRANDQEFFLQGNKAYSQRQFQGALQSYEKMKRKGYATYYNMANCWYHLGNSAQAVYYWKKAQQSCPAVVFEQCEQQVKCVVPDLSASNTHGRVYPWISTLGLQLIFLFFWYILLAYWFKKGITRTNLCVSVCILSFMGYGLYNRFSAEGVLQAVVINPASCYVGPSNQYRQIETLKPTTVVQVIEEQEAWLKVATQSKKVWLRSDDVTVI